VEVIVGGEKVQFTVYKPTICKRSKFFASACSVAWAKGCKPIELLDIEPRIFDAYLGCAYEYDVSELFKIKSFHTAIRVYTLADRLGDLTSANAVIDYLIAYANRECVVPNCSMVQLAFDLTPPNCPLQRLLVDYYVHELDGDTIIQDTMGEHELLPPEFLLEVFKEYLRLKRKTKCSDKVWDVFVTDVAAQPTCHYHQHDDLWPPCKPHN
jgi:hypothetical protein